MARTRCLLVLVTAPDRKTARSLAALALNARLVACANLIGPIESHYWWQGKMEQSREVLILFKTTPRAVSSLRKLILANHPYDTAEFLAFTATSGAERYLAWVAQSVQLRPGTGIDNSTPER